MNQLELGFEKVTRGILLSGLKTLRRYDRSCKRLHGGPQRPMIVYGRRLLRMANGVYDDDEVNEETRSLAVKVIQACHDMGIDSVSED